jgi:hypothetical protein
MEDEEDLFSMLDGINHATNDYGYHEQEHGGRLPQKHGSQNAQQENAFTSDHEYQSYQPQQAAPNRSMMAPSRTMRRDDHSDGLFMSPSRDPQGL